MKSLSTSNFINILGVFNFTLLLAISASFLIASPNSSNAETVIASAGSSAYSASISTNDAVTIPITPTATQAEYVTEVDDSKVIFSSTCPTGATVTLSTDSSDNALTRTGSDAGVKTINATTGDGLSDNTWGYKIQGSAFSGVPVSSSPVVLHNSTGVETNTDIKVIYGVKTDNNLPSGVYTNNVVYTVAVQPSCLKYSLSFDLDGGTGASGVDYSTKSISYGEKINLSTYTPTKAGYVFAGWTNGSSSFSGTETSVDVNSNNFMELTLKAVWKNGIYDFDFVSPNGGEQAFTAPADGYYKLEVWGAQGGNANNSVTGGYGGYSVGVIRGTQSQKLYINVGGKGKNLYSNISDYKVQKVDGGYNGGGYANCYYNQDSLYCSSGGGATSIATASGVLKNLSSNKNNVIIVAGGGGGSSYFTASNYGNGGNGGGIQGNNAINVGNGHTSYGGTQSAGGWASCDPSNSTMKGGFGYGGNTGINASVGSYGGSGGGGYYGGGGSIPGCGTSPGGGGSGYIGSSTLISGAGITKHMTCYSCTTSTADATRTNSNTATPSAIATADVAKTGNGYARITYLGTSI